MLNQTFFLAAVLLLKWFPLYGTLQEEDNIYSHQHSHQSISSSSLVETQDLLKNMLFSWTDGKNHSFAPYHNVSKEIDSTATPQDTIKKSIDYLVSQGESAEEIYKIMGYAGLSIPQSAYIDKGFHSNVFGRPSMLGSFYPHLRAFYSDPLNWIKEHKWTLLGYAVTASTLSNVVNSMLLPTVAANQTAIDIDNKCNINPYISGFQCKKFEGTYENSCINIEYGPYGRFDYNAPPTCKLSADCPTPEGNYVNNAIYYSPDHQFTYIRNNNGTLRDINQNPLHNTPDFPPLCNALPGSYRETCEVNIQPYISTDPDLSTTPFCNMTAICEGRIPNTTQTNTIIYHDRYDPLRPFDRRELDNCNGTLVEHI